MLEYELIDNLQRETTYTWREETLRATGDELLELWVKRAYTSVVSRVCAGDRPSDLERSEFVDAMNAEQLFWGRLPDEVVKVDSEAEAVAIITEAALPLLRERLAPAEGAYDELLRRYFVACIDLFWMEELEALKELRDGIGLRGLLGTDVKVQYNVAAGELYEDLIAEHARRGLRRLWLMQVTKRSSDPSTDQPSADQVAAPPATPSTQSTAKTETETAAA